MIDQSKDYSNDPSYKTLKRISGIMDEAIKIPGTRFTVGADALIGFVPVVGDTVSVAISGIALFTVARNGLPYRLIMAMAFNLLIDYLIGLVPALGDVLDIFYRANRNNLKLIEGYYEKNPQAINQVNKSSTGLIVFTAFIFLILTAIIVTIGYFVKSIIWQTFGWS
ncbi:DUF4112 domain-containing protein [Flammeovirga yaeyamensis]|uniref:DUF4112 domain-containing protein n=1 Tax=Flammeovirga yaeyamensis TaxID=367791 RepID=A0AAX1N6U5_9BACT|nr:MULTISPECIES: DUF4112 domain-containing protein [Flammeovirga]ANQ50850.1 DUF4112 domain-containing protein [Flammeovirga sp. MY04]MBB3700752.1 hypothetical protein [Flammeovirga yaeyamensis]NMF37892.1 DUF4112 domain-containing protein [Flammeovirga yaeyamensis]QWG01747.1 DUF4112 domain-containing protein [Flammeovirga yaeyamensis]